MQSPSGPKVYPKPCEGDTGMTDTGLPSTTRDCGSAAFDGVVAVDFKSASSHDRDGEADNEWADGTTNLRVDSANQLLMLPQDVSLWPIAASGSPASIQRCADLAAGAFAEALVQSACRSADEEWRQGPTTGETSSGHWAGCEPGLGISARDVSLPLHPRHQSDQSAAPEGIAVATANSKHTEARASQALLPFAASTDHPRWPQLQGDATSHVGAPALTDSARQSEHLPLGMYDPDREESILWSEDRASLPHELSSMCTSAADVAGMVGKGMEIEKDFVREHVFVPAVCSTSALGRMNEEFLRLLFHFHHAPREAKDRVKHILGMNDGAASGVAAQPACALGAGVDVEGVYMGRTIARADDHDACRRIRAGCGGLAGGDGGRARPNLSESSEHIGGAQESNNSFGAGPKLRVRVECTENDSQERSRKRKSAVQIAISEGSKQEDSTGQTSLPNDDASSSNKGSVSYDVSSQLRRLEFDAYLLRHRLLRTNSQAQQNDGSAASRPPPWPRDGKQPDVCHDAFKVSPDMCHDAFKSDPLLDEVEETSLSVSVEVGSEREEGKEGKEGKSRGRGGGGSGAQIP